MEIKPNAIALLLVIPIFEKIQNMKNTPERIFLQFGPQVDSDDDYRETTGVTWCETLICDTDVEFIRYDIVETILHEVARRWGSDHGGSTVGILGRQAKEIIEKHGTE